jgi:hypothetical protein
MFLFSSVVLVVSSTIEVKDISGKCSDEWPLD